MHEQFPGSVSVTDELYLSADVDPPDQQRAVEDSRAAEVIHGFLLLKLLHRNK